LQYLITILFIFIGTAAFAQIDSALINEATTEAYIQEIVTTRKAPSSKDKEVYLSQVTKYGFKNLFTKYSYTPTASYQSQVNPNAEQFMQDYLRRHQKHLINMKGWGQPYFTLIDNILTQYGLPRELKYVAVIESNLKTGATSWVGAAGPWQFMPATARQYGLQVNGYIDERRDYYKSTHAAARYLLNSYKVYKDWLLAIASYNGGMGNVNKAIRRSGSRNFWQLQHYLPTESKNYVKKFIATHYIMEGHGGVTTGTGAAPISNGGTFAVTMPNVPMAEPGGLNPFAEKPNLTQAEQEDVATQTISGKFNSMVIAKNITLDVVTFNRYNPNFDALMASHGNYDLRLPQDKMQIFMANKYTILNECVQILLNDNGVVSTQTIYPTKPPSTGKKKSKKH
jgi:membrane-bound lytic murein transglycosylase D